jgi:RNA polymerase sigma-70 factor (ECF subfamily)
MTQDEWLVRRVCAGDVEAFRSLVERFQRPILRFVLNITADRHAAEDIAQEVFLAAYRKIHSFDPDRSQFVTWLFTIARNKALTAIRRREKEPAGEGAEPAGDCASLGELERSELESALDRALADLPPEQKTAFVLAEFEDLSYDQIARIERTRVGTIRSRISRARAKLRQALREYKERS